MPTQYTQSLMFRADTQATPEWFAAAIFSSGAPYSIGRLRLLGGAGIWEIAFWYDVNEQKGDISLTILGQATDPTLKPTKARLVVNNGTGEIQLLCPARGGWLNIGELIVDCNGLCELNEDPGPSGEVAAILKELDL